MLVLVLVQLPPVLDQPPLDLLLHLHPVLDQGTNPLLLTYCYSCMLVSTQSANSSAFVRLYY